ncbi:MAG: CAP domain-containing protein [Polyangiaceae bacterium]
MSKRLNVFLLCFLFAGWFSAACGTTEPPTEENLTDEVRVPASVLGDPGESGKKLADAVNDYREKNGLARIAWSPSLGIVAATHLRDIEKWYSPGAQDNCNMHGWSNQTFWHGCCYVQADPDGPCMWDKPRELTGFPGNGFEVAASIGGGGAKAADAVDAWDSSPGHRSVILNQGDWRRLQWRSIGAAMGKNYAFVWFSDAAQPVSSR